MLSATIMQAIIGFNRQPGLWSLAGWTTSGLLGVKSWVARETVILVNHLWILYTFFFAKKVDRCFFVFFGDMWTCIRQLVACKHIIFCVEGRAVFLVVFPKWQIQGLHRVKALVLSIEILCFDWKDLKSDFRTVSHWQFSVMLFSRSKNSDGFPQNSTIIFWKLRFYSEAFSSLCRTPWFAAT